MRGMRIIILHLPPTPTSTIMILFSILSLVRPTASLTIRHPISFHCRSLSLSSKERHTKLQSKFLNQVEESIHKVQSKHPHKKQEDTFKTNLLNLPPSQRESVGVANRLSNRLFSLHKNNDCPTCWLQRAHCICPSTPPIESLVPPIIHRVFLIMHHKEIGLVVDTAKLLLNSMPDRARLVVSGIDGEYQDSVGELMDALEEKERKCIVLFPTDDAKPFLDLYRENEREMKMQHEMDEAAAEALTGEYDVVVMDGTWQQARKIHQRYIPLEKDGGPQRVCLSQEALDILGEAADNPTEGYVVGAGVGSSAGIEKGGNGRQLRRHPIKWKEVSTLEATRLLFRDMMVATGKIGDEGYTNSDGKQCHDLLAEYQRISDEAAVRQLGPPRERMVSKK